MIAPQDGIDRGGLSSDMLSSFFDLLFSTHCPAAEEQQAAAEAEPAAARGLRGWLFERSDEASPAWLPRAALVARGGDAAAERLVAVGRVMCKRHG